VKRRKQRLKLAIKFATNIPQTLAFPYGDSKEVEGNFGPQHMYTVEVNGEKDRLYASPYLHDQLVSGGVGAGSVLTITKVELEGGKAGWNISTDAPASGQAPMPAAAPTNGAAPRPINGHAPHNRTHYTHLLAAAISDAATAAHLANVKIDSEGGDMVNFTSADIEKLAVHLSMTYQQKNVPLKEETPAPVPVVAPAPVVEEPPMPVAPPIAAGSTGEDDLPF